MRSSAWCKFGIHGRRSLSEMRCKSLRYMQYAFIRVDGKAEETGIPPTGNSIAERLTAH